MIIPVCSVILYNHFPNTALFTLLICHENNILLQNAEYTKPSEVATGGVL